MSPDVVHVAVEDVLLAMVQDVIPFLARIAIFFGLIKGIITIFRFIMKNGNSDAEHDSEQYTSYGSEVEDSDDDCAYRHAPEPATVDECAYTHDEVVGKTGRVIRAVTRDDNGMVNIPGSGVYSARSLSGETFHVGKKVEIVSVRNGTVVVSEKL